MHANRFLSLLAPVCLILAATRALADEGSAAVAQGSPLSQRAHRAIERGLAFLEQDAAKWRKELQCAACHHGTMTVWVYMEAKSRGYRIEAETIRDAVEWTKERLDRIDLPRDTRPGWSMLSTPALYLATMALAVPQQDALSPDELKRIAAHLVRHQESDGAWSWASAPPKNRPPPVFESDEVATRLAFLVLAPHLRKDSHEKPDIRDRREKAREWLKSLPPSDTTQAATLRLLMAVREHEAAEEIKSLTAELLNRRNEDGGWGQVKGRASDAYATGQVLYVLNLAGVKSDSPAVTDAVKFLLASQKDDGSWPMTPRAHPDATPSNNTMPITYFGSAWGTLGLMRSVRSPERE